jgi:hypothetical protein
MQFPGKSPLIEFLSKAEKMGISPKGLGFVRRKGDPKLMDLSAFYIGD